MILYENSIGTFIEDANYNRISDILLGKLRENHLSGGTPSEINSWVYSLQFMKNVVSNPQIPKDCRCAIEYNIPQTSKRIDFMIYGQNENQEDHLIIVELKQWAKVSKVDDSFKHSILSDLRSHEPTPHPSYQAYSYKSLILNYCDKVNLPENCINPCAYLHNMNEEYRPILEDSIYSDWTSEAPCFLKDDFEKISNFITKYIKAKSSDSKLLYEIDGNKARPTKNLQDSLDSMLCGNEEFKMIDEQVVAFDFIMRAIERAQEDNRKHVIVISGGPGTGKSVLAINVLVECIRKLKLNASYITKNSAPRNCYTELLTSGNAKKELDLKLAIKSPHSLPFIPLNRLDVGIFDEAHRMQKKPYMYKGEDMLSDAIYASKVSVFFVDDNQRITVNDIYDADSIYQTAKRYDAVFETEKPFELSSQFRCNGSDGYLSFLNNLLGIQSSANPTLEGINYDFRVFDNPQALKDALKEADNGKNKSRMCAGYCYDWNVKHKRGDWDIIIDSFKAKWNLPNDDSFAVNPNSFDEIGCIHTVQGMEFDYVGVFIGKDLIYSNGKVTTNQYAISKDDKTSGIRSCRDKELASKLIRNTYRVLLSRGQKGCFVYCEDKALREYFRSFCS